MATHSITNVAILSNTVDIRGMTSKATGVVAEERQVIAATTTEVQSRDAEEVSKEAIDEAVSHLKEYVQSMQRDMDFSVDDKTGRFVVKVIDSQTKEVIRQIPSEEILAISRHLADALEEMDETRGFLIELKA
jgi:flagellar protein FlaG